MEAHSPHMDMHCNENHLFAFKHLHQADKKSNVLTPSMLAGAEYICKQRMNVSVSHLLHA